MSAADPPVRPQARLYRCAKGLAHVATLELRHAKTLARGKLPHLLHQRSHDLLFLPRPLNAATPRAVLSIEESFACLGYGRFKLSPTQLDRVAKALAPRRKPVRVVASAEGTRFDRREFGRFIEKELGRRGLKITENGEPDLFVFAIDEAFYLARRDGLWSDPPHRHAAGMGRIAALPADIAAAMAFLLRPADGDVVVDPCCGTGGLLAEFKAYAPGAALHGRDMDREAVTLARRRLKGLSRVDVKAGDGTASDLGDGSTTAFLANPPFGVQMGDRGANPELYRSLLREMVRLGARTGWRAAIVSSDGSALDAALADQRGIVAEQRRIALDIRGRPAVISIWAGGVI